MPPAAAAQTARPLEDIPDVFAESYHELHKMDYRTINITYDSLANKLRGMVAERQRSRHGQPGQKQDTPHEQLWVAVAGGPGSGE